MGQQARDINDVALSTLRELGKGKVTDLSFDLTEYPFATKLVKKKKVVFGSGYEIRRQIILDDNGSARHVGLDATDNVQTVDVMAEMIIPFRHSTSNYGWDERILKMNREPAKLKDYLKVQKHAGMVSMTKLVESSVWAKPATSADVDTPWGIPMWVIKSSSGTSAASGVGGFNGQNPAGFSDSAGIDSSVQTRHANYAHTYVTVDKPDMIRKARRACRQTNFKAPVQIESYKTGDDVYGFYTVDSVIGTMETILENQNDKLGTDLASMDGKMMFRSNPVHYVPQLDADTSNPFYGINWSVSHFMCLEGEYMEEKGPFTSDDQHNRHKMFLDLSWNFFIDERRRCFVLSL